VSAVEIFHSLPHRSAFSFDLHVIFTRHPQGNAFNGNWQRRAASARFNLPSPSSSLPEFRSVNLAAATPTIALLTPEGR
jgi:hypothetical protein